MHSFALVDQVESQAHEVELLKAKSEYTEEQSHHAYLAIVTTGETYVLTSSPCKRLQFEPMPCNQAGK